MGDQPLLSASSSDDWTGSNPTLNVECLQEGLQPLSGSFQLAFGGEKTAPLPHNVDAKIIKTALEALKLISSVSVTRFVNNNGFNYFVTFLSEQGNLPTIAIDNSELTGPNANANVATIQDGVLPSNFGKVHTVSTSSIYTITRLKTGAPYTVRMRSFNSEGMGDFQIAFPPSITPKTFPSQPTNTAMISMGNILLKMIWEPPTNNGGGKF